MNWQGFSVETLKAPRLEVKCLTWASLSCCVCGVSPGVRSWLRCSPLLRTRCRSEQVRWRFWTPRSQLTHSGRCALDSRRIGSPPTQTSPISTSSQWETFPCWPATWARSASTGTRAVPSTTGRSTRRPGDWGWSGGTSGTRTLLTK